LFPAALYTNVFEWVDENGSAADKRAIDSIQATLESRVDSAVRPVYDYIVATTNSYHTNLIYHLREYETDPVFVEKCFDTKIALGYMSDAVDGAVQLLEGTNDTAGTLKFKDVTLVDTNGVIPESAIPWASTYNYVDDVLNSAVSNKVSRTGDVLSGDLTIQNSGMAAAVFDNESDDAVSLCGVMTFDQSNGRDAVFSGFCKISYGSSIPSWFEQGVYGLNSHFSYDDSSGLYVSTNNLWDTLCWAETSVDVSNISNAIAHVEIYTNSVFVAEYTHTGTIENNINIDDIGATVYRITRVKNPGISLSDINGPVHYVDLVSPSGFVFRLKVTDSGDITVSKIK
jgi:hypothetical protein